jgi:Protein of unknown function (DUF2004)
MSKYILPYFDELDVNSLDDCYDAEMEFNGRQIDLDLNFDEESTTTKRLEIVKNFIENLTEFNQIATKAINDDFKTGKTVKHYIKHNLKMLGEEHFSSLFDNYGTSMTNTEQLLAKIYLKRVGFYPEDNDNFAVFDYTFGQDLTDYLIVVNFNKKGKIDYMTMES